MLKNYIKGSNIIELVEESKNEDATSYKAILRVTGDPAAWSSIIVEILMAPDEDSEYLTSVRKEYYISEDNSPTFCWVLIVWGDLFQAFAEIGPILQQSGPSEAVSVKEPKSVDPPVVHTQKRPSSVVKRIHRTEDGNRIVGTVPLPFKRGSRDNPGTTRTLGKKKGVGAYVSNVTSDGGL